MKLTLKFEQSDFENMRTFEKAVKRQLGQNVYVSCDSLCFYFDFPKELSARMRPSLQTPVNQLEFELESSLPDSK